MCCDCHVPAPTDAVGFLERKQRMIRNGKRRDQAKVQRQKKKKKRLLIWFRFWLFLYSLFAVHQSPCDRDDSGWRLCLVLYVCCDEYSDALTLF
jgi:hypothetical protein